MSAFLNSCAKCDGKHGPKADAARRLDIICAVRRDGIVQSTQEIFEQLRKVLSELFEIEPSQVTLEAHLYNDLEIDSIDTIDLILRLKELTGRKIQPDQFRHVRTVGDAVNAIHALVQNKPAAA